MRGLERVDKYLSEIGMDIKQENWVKMWIIRVDLMLRGFLFMVEGD